MSVLPGGSHKLDFCISTTLAPVSWRPSWTGQQCGLGGCDQSVGVTNLMAFHVYYLGTQSVKFLDTSHWYSGSSLWNIKYSKLTVDSFDTNFAIKSNLKTIFLPIL